MVRGSMKNEVEETTGNYLTFRLDDEEYGVKTKSVREIIGVIHATSIPKTPDYIRGVINLRGEVIPVMELRKKFEMQDRPDTDETCIVVLETTDDKDKVKLTGIVVDSVSEVLDIETSNIMETPEFGDDVNTEYINAMAKSEDKVRILLDIEAILKSDNTEIQNTHMGQIKEVQNV